MLALMSSDGAGIITCGTGCRGEGVGIITFGSACPTGEGAGGFHFGVATGVVWTCWGRTLGDIWGSFDSFLMIGLDLGFGFGVGLGWSWGCGVGIEPCACSWAGWVSGLGLIEGGATCTEGDGCGASDEDGCI